MNKDDIQAVLVLALARRRVEDDPWYRLCSGTIAEADLVELRDGIESPAALETKLELFAPASEQVREATLDDLLDGCFPTSSDDVLGASAPSPSPELVTTAPVTEARPRPQSPSRPPLVVVAIVAALAAALLLWSMARPDPTPDAPTLPDFAIDLGPGDADGMRGASPAPPDRRCEDHYRMDQDIRVRLRPGDALHEPAAVAVLARPEYGSPGWRKLAKPVQSPEGVLTIDQSIPDLELRPGVWTLTFYVSRLGQRVDVARLETLPAGRHPGVTVVDVTVCLTN